MHVQSIDLATFADVYEAMSVKCSRDFGPVLVHEGRHPELGVTVLVQDITGASMMTENPLAN